MRLVGDAVVWAMTVDVGGAVVVQMLEAGAGLIDERVGRASAGLPLVVGAVEDHDGAVSSDEL